MKVTIVQSSKAQAAGGLWAGVQPTREVKGRSCRAATLQEDDVVDAAPWVSWAEAGGFSLLPVLCFTSRCPAVACSVIASQTIN